MMEGRISQVFWTVSRKFAFQKVGGCYRVYNQHGEFVTEFRSFDAMCEYIQIAESI